MSDGSLLYLMAKHTVIEVSRRHQTSALKVCMESCMVAIVPTCRVHNGLQRRCIKKFMRLIRGMSRVIRKFILPTLKNDID